MAGPIDGDSPGGTTRGPRAFAPGLAVALLAAAWFGYDLAAEPHFVDESAYVAQAYFADLFLDGRRDDPAWLEYPAYDLPPMAKYLVGGALRVAGLPRPGPSAARAWYLNTSTRPETPAMLVAARWPSVLMGALGCAAIYALGVQMHGRAAGLAAAALLAINPLYRMHARRAMSDVPAEALLLAAAAAGLWAWSRTLRRGFGVGPGLGYLAAGVLGGLATLSKLNGSLGLMTLLAWGVLALGLAYLPVGRRLSTVAGAVAAGAVGFAAFAALNPFLTARPSGPLPGPVAEVAARSFWGRAATVAEHRASVSGEAASLFPHDALTTASEKVAAVAVQGYGRFGPLGPSRSDSTIRFDRRQDWGAPVWLPAVALGAAAVAVRGRAQARAGAPPTAWAVLVQAGLALAVVTAFIPLAWDRYYLSIQAGSALLVAGLAATLLDAAAGAVRRPAPDAGAVP